MGFVFAVMSVYIIDHLITKKFGNARVDWNVDYTFRGGASRKDYWAQFVDIREWSVERHPVLQSADVRMVKCTDKIGVAKTSDNADGEEPDTELKPVDPQVMKPGLGFILRFKAGSGPRAGQFYCTRKCIEMEQPRDGAWRYTTQTVEVGAGYSFDIGSEHVELQMWPPEQDGSIRCEMSGKATTSSRVHRWWSALIPASKAGALAFLETIDAETSRAKKSD